MHNAARPGSRWWGEAALAAAGIAVLAGGPTGTQWTWGLATVLAAGLAGKLAGIVAGHLLLGRRRPGPFAVVSAADSAADSAVEGAVEDERLADALP